MTTSLSLTVAIGKAAEESNRTLLLRESEPPESNPQYSRVIQAMDSPNLFEQAKIMYLITQLRLSRYQFERNGAVYEGSRAASHLLTKYSAVRDRIESAEQFIEYIANGSTMSGQPYYILDEEGERYPTHEVLMNELTRLEQSLEGIELTLSQTNQKGEEP